MEYKKFKVISKTKMLHLESSHGNRLLVKVRQYAHIHTISYLSSKDCQPLWSAKCIHMSI